MEAVKGLQGYWHATMGDWVQYGEGRGNKLQALCGKGVSPNYRRVNEKDIRQVVNCPKCREKL